MRKFATPDAPDRAALLLQRTRELLLECRSGVSVRGGRTHRLWRYQQEECFRRKGRGSP